MNNKAIIDYEYSNEFEGFIEDNIGKIENIVHEIVSEYVHSDVAIVHDEDETTFVTFGVGAREMNAPEGMYKRFEISMSASKDTLTDKQTFLIANELIKISKFPFRNNTWLGPFHTINASEEFSKEFGFKYFIFDVLSEYDNSVVILKCIPIYESEYEAVCSTQTGSIDFLEKYYDKFILDDNVFGRVNVHRKQIKL
jgi:hypothetical protein